MEPRELSLALLQPQVTVVAILGELLATLPKQDEMMLLVSTRCLYRDLEKFTKELRATLYRIDYTWRRCNVTSDDDDDPVTSLSEALAAYEYTPWTAWDNVTRAASEWQGAVDGLVTSWVQLAWAATRLCNICRRAADMATTATARARELQDEAARDGTALENMVELGQALGGEEGAEVVARHEAQVRIDARVTASEARRATMVKQWVDVALGLLERLVAACDEATTFPRELQHRVGDIEATLKGTNEVSPDVPNDLVNKVAVAKDLWEANARLVMRHLLGPLDDIMKFYFTGAPTSPSVCEVAERCQIAIEDIPRLLLFPECPQTIPTESPLSPALLHPQATVVAILGELLATLPSRDEMMLLMSARCLYRGLKDFTWELWDTLYCTGDTWWHCSVTSYDDDSTTSDDDDDPVTSLSEALAAYEYTPWTTWDNVTRAASEWQGAVNVLVNRWAELAKKATEHHNTCREMVTTAWARELQAEAARFETALENTVELGQALGGEEGAEVVAGYKAQVRRDASLAASEAARATMVRQRLEAALGLLERLVAACDEDTAFPQELQHRIGDIEATLKGANEASPDVPEDLEAKVAVAERLWEANTSLAKDHLLGTVDDIMKFYFDGAPASPSACEVAERCQRAIEDIPRLLRTPECPQSIPAGSPVSMELQEPSLSQLLEALVSVVATLGKVAATVTGPHRGVRRCVPPKSLHAALRNFTWSLRKTLDHPGVTSLGDPAVTSLGQALATLRATPGATWADVRAAASAWRELVAAHEQRWDQLKEEATKLRDACEDVAPARAGDLQDEATHRGTAGDSLVATAQQLMVALDREEEASVGPTRNAQVSVATNEAVGEAVVATKRARVAIRRRHWAEVALGPLQRLVAACDRATEFISYMECQLRDIEAARRGQRKCPPMSPRPWWPKWLRLSSCGRPAPACSSITCWGHLGTSTAFS
ncbi:uncharacterized protein LOC132340515 [Haemorhous mexicanus]|uniref:uncharacterized protein LOC132340515 n=1 Tax=Haemorhous mexicanus TaxID=30427 RepID=UPI0028BD17C2|nr:uncharacterized protein LOC132340515 [Haemorhous mexicanus]